MPYGQVPNRRVVAGRQAENKALQGLVQQQAEGGRTAAQRLKRLKETYAQLATVVDYPFPSPHSPSFPLHHPVLPGTCELRL